MKLAIILAFSIVSVAHAGTKSKSAETKGPAMSQEQRNKMADMHEKMATCLRSSKSFEECHKDMSTACKADKDACPMMMAHHGGMGHGKHKCPYEDKDEKGEKDEE